MAKADQTKLTGVSGQLTPTAMTADHFIARLQEYQSPTEAANYQRHFQTQAGGYGEGDRFLGVRMGEVFTLAKAFIAMPLDEVEKLLESPIHEARVGAVSIMDFQARNKKSSAAQRQALCDLYLRRHDRINNWDLVDRAAPYVIGGYLADKPREVLYTLARSPNLWERRTAIVSTYYFIRQGEVEDTFQIAELLLHDEHDLIHKAVGGWLREAGKQAPERLLDFLDQHAAAMPRRALRYAIEHMPPEQQKEYLGRKKAG